MIFGGHLLNVGNKLTVHEVELTMLQCGCLTIQLCDSTPFLINIFSNREWQVVKHVYKYDTVKPKKVGCGHGYTMPIFFNIICNK